MQSVILDSELRQKGNEMIDYQAKTGAEIEVTGTRGEKWVNIRRYRDGEFETLFVARAKYNKPGRVANAYKKWTLENLNINTCTQDDLDRSRAAKNELDHAVRKATAAAKAKIAA